MLTSRHRLLAALVVPLAASCALAGLATPGTAGVAQDAVNPGVAKKGAVTVSTSPSRPIAGERTVFSGRLPGGRRPVVLQKKAGKKWKVIDRAKSKKTGKYRLAARVAKSGKFRIHAPRAGGKRAITRTRSVKVAGQSARMLTTPTPFVAGIARTVTARVTPARPGRVVALQRRAGSTWQTVASARSDGGGIARIEYAATVPGSASYRVVGQSHRGSRTVVSATTGIRTARVTELLSGGQGSGLSSFDPSISADGRWVAFTSESPLLPADTDDRNDAYLFDRQTGVLSLLLPAANSHVNNPMLSANGRYVALQSTASNLAGEPDLDYDVFVLDRRTGTVDLVSATPGGASGGTHSYVHSISDDGRFVAFTSYADDLVSFLPPPNTSVRHPYLRDRATGTTRALDRVGLDWATGNVFEVEVSGDGSRVAFASGDAALDPGNVNVAAIFAWEIAADGAISGRTNLTPGVQAREPKLSRNGDLMAFSSSQDILPVDTNGQTDAYLRTSVGAYLLASPIGPGDSSPNDISADGRYVVFNTENPMPGDTNGTNEDIVVWDTATGLRHLVTRGGPGASVEAALSADGSVLALSSEATGLAPGATGDTNVFATVLR